MNKNTTERSIIMAYKLNTLFGSYKYEKINQNDLLLKSFN